MRAASAAVLGALALHAASCDGRGPVGGEGIEAAGATLSAAALPPPARGATLAGRVLDGERRALAGARIAARPRDGGEAAELVALSDADGAFRIEGVPWSDARLSASHAELRAAVLVLGALRPGDVRDGLELVLAAGASVGGRVWRSAGSAAGGARIWIESAREEPGRGDALAADAEGRFLAAGLDEGPFRVSAWEGSGDAREVASAPGVAAGTLELELVLAPAAQVALEVAGGAAPGGLRAALRDPDGRPLDAAPLAGGELPWRSEPAERGLALGGLAAGDYWVGLEDREGGRAGWGFVSLRAGERARVELALDPATRLCVEAGEALAPFVARGPGGLPARLSRAGSASSSYCAVLPAGRYAVECGGAPERPPETVTLSGEPELVLRLR